MKLKERTYLERLQGVFLYLAEHPELFNDNGDCDYLKLWDGITAAGLYNKGSRFGDTYKVLSRMVATFLQLKGIIAREVSADISRRSEAHSE